MATNATDLRTTPTRMDDLLSSRLFKVVSCILVFVACLLVAGLIIQATSYWGGLRAAVAGSSRDVTVDHAAVITYARGLGAAFIKTSALFFGFILIFIGSLYVLRTAEVAYEVHLTTGNTQGYLQTSSPGLVIVTLGVVLTIVSLLTKNDLDYQQTTTSEQPSVRTAVPTDAPANGQWIPAKSHVGETAEASKEATR